MLHDRNGRKWFARSKIHSKVTPIAELAQPVKRIFHLLMRRVFLPEARKGLLGAPQIAFAWRGALRWKD
jgi:hypothetical protein